LNDLFVPVVIELYSKFQKPGPQHDPCGQPFVTLLFILTLLVDIDARWLKYPLLRLYKFLRQPRSFKPCRNLGHHAASKAPDTSRLVMLTKPLFSSTGSIIFFYLHGRVCSTLLWREPKLSVLQ